MGDPGSTIDAAAVRSHLDERTQAGRTPAEAAGEILFAKDKQLSLGALSQQSRAEIDDIVNDWLAHAADLATVTAHRLVATQYTRFLTERVSWDLSTQVSSQIDIAWQEWRSRSKGDPS